LVLTTAAIVVAGGCSGPEPPVESASETISTHRSVTVRWEDNFEDALERATAENKAVLVNFYAEWCVWCKRMESTTLRDANVAAMLSNSVVPVSLDVEGDGEELSTEFGVEALPTVLVLDGEGRELGRIPGYLPPAGFLEAVEGFLQQG
jgi:thiol:disulfide interchange protein